MDVLGRACAAGTVAVVAAGSLLLGGCSPEQRPAGTTSVSRAAGPGVVQPPPPGAAQVDVILKEWALDPATKSVKAGQVYFLADNQGPEDVHELVIIKSDLPPDRLPVNQGRVPENQVQVIGEIEGFTPKSRASGVFNLTPGNYVLICNIAEMEDGRLESHYEMGMRSAFTVTP